MSLARPVLKGVSLMLTRRARQRQLLLRPSDKTNRTIGYVIAVMQNKWNIDVHAICVLSNHLHICLTDPDGNIVDFQRDCHSFIARALNAQHGDFESLWSSSQTSRVECERPEDLLDKIAYIMANPVESPLVCYGRSWPGIRRAWPSRPRTFRKPKTFFRGQQDGGVWPESAVLELSRPPGYDHLDDDQLGALIRATISKREKRFREQHRANGRPFLGRAAVKRQSRYATPRSREPRFRISPKVACRDQGRRIERLRANKRWSDAYRAALRRWRAGDRHVEFPPGTYKMRVVHHVNCAVPPD
jgi:REP element-mobilizing transposase RayT